MANTAQNSEIVKPGQEPTQSQSVWDRIAASREFQDLIAIKKTFIVPAFILSVVWIEGSESRTRVILMVSGALFLVLTFLVAAWSRRIRDQFAPQDDLV